MTSRQIQYAGRPPYWKSSIGNISAIYSPIFVKFWFVEVESGSDTSCIQNKFQKYKMADGRRFENGSITISQPEINRFRFQRNLVFRCKFWFEEWSHDKKKWKIFKFKMADDRHIENRLLTFWLYLCGYNICTAVLFVQFIHVTSGLI